jgi:hypothetical protein
VNVLAAVVEKPGVMSLQEFPRPSIGPEMVRETPPGQPLVLRPE